MSIWDIYIDWDKIDKKKALKKRLKQQKEAVEGKKSKLPLIILVSSLSVILICIILLITMLLFGWSSNPLTRAINRAKTTSLYEKYLFEETGTKINLSKVSRDITDEEERMYYDEVIEPFVEDPGIIGEWFEYLIMDEWDFATANEDIMYEIEAGDTDMLLALCSRHGYPEFKEDYGYLLGDEEEDEEDWEDEEEDEDLEEDEDEEYLDEDTEEDDTDEYIDEDEDEDYYEDDYTDDDEIYDESIDEEYEDEDYTDDEDLTDEEEYDDDEDTDEDTSEDEDA